MVIPESKRLNVLLRDFRVSRNHMAIVIDEYGGVSGLITIEDVLEEIVGEIGDEYDEDDEVLIHSLGNNLYQVQALTPIDELNEKFDSNLSDDDYDTVGGLLLAEFGRVPEFDEVDDARRPLRVPGHQGGQSPHHHSGNECPGDLASSFSLLAAGAGQFPGERLRG